MSQKSEIEQARAENEASNRKGNVICCQLKMMKQPNYLKGYLNVFPNFRHQNRTDGFGCASLSPMSLGPVVIFNKEVAKNLENFHQGSKCFDCETDKKGEPSEVFFENQASFLADIIPHRHKFKSANKTKYFVWKDEFEKLHKLNYIESRQFYCNLYERLASETNDFQTLKSLIKNGTNIQLCGYDGREIKDIEAEYLNQSKPFGHELCLFHMLTEPDSTKYIWKKYKTFNF